MRFAVMMVTDGRWDCFTQMVESWSRDCTDFDRASQLVVVDDSCDPVYHEGVRALLPAAYHVRGHDRLGFAGAIQAGWGALLPTVDYVLHLEDDFVLERPVSVEVMARVLLLRSNVVQCALLRQPVNEAERSAGGVVEMWPKEYVDCNAGDLYWLEHRLFFTTNPSVYRRNLVEAGWPCGERSEARFTDMVLEPEGAVSAYLGSRYQPPWVRHIGDQRVGSGY